MAARPLVGVYGAGRAITAHVTLPAVMTAPIRPDIVHDVHTRMAKNARQAYSVSKFAGHQTSAESWGTGRAVARIPRVSGGGTHRAGQGAFGNMCRGGRMYSPTKTWRRWHRKINTSQRRYALTSALSATAVPPLLMARGHRVGAIPEVPLVLDTKAYEGITKTKKAVELLEQLRALDDVQKAKESTTLRRGKGKMRNRRFVHRRGPLLVYGADNSLVRAFRNLPGLETCSVNALNLLQLAPGGHLGRFVIWTKDAFQRLDALFGTYKKPSTELAGYRLPRPSLSNPDLARIINSDEVQSVLRDKKAPARLVVHKKNALRNVGALIKLNPHARSVRRREALQKEQRKKDHKAGKKRDPVGKAQRGIRKNLKKTRKTFYKNLLAL